MFGGRDGGAEFMMDVCINWQLRMFVYDDGVGVEGVG